MKKIGILLIALCLALPVFARAATYEPASRPLTDGVDISVYNDVTDFSEMKSSGIGMVYIRSSLGFSYVDPKLERNADGALEAGLPFGFYHFCTASTVEEATRQAEFFHETTRAWSPELRYVLELDPTRSVDDETFNAVAEAFLSRISALTDTTAAIYCSADTARDRYDERVAQYPLWVADWGVDSPEPNGIWPVWTGWQYAASDNVAGTEGRIDQDYFTKEMRIAQSPTPTPTPTPAPTCAPRAYVVQTGDTLTAIARRFDTTVEALREKNGLTGSTIYPGQILIY